MEYQKYVQYNVTHFNRENISILYGYSGFLTSHIQLTVIFKMHTFRCASVNSFVIHEITAIKLNCTVAECKQHTFLDEADNPLFILR
jgi:hypothetical protein